MYDLKSIFRKRYRTHSKSHLIELDAGCLKILELICAYRIILAIVIDRCLICYMIVVTIAITIVKTTNSIGSVAISYPANCLHPH
jgi:hypothetical protein